MLFLPLSCMKYIPIFLLQIFVCLIFSSCKKEEPAPVAPTPLPPATLADYSQLATGNWWAYQTMRYDTSGNYWSQGTGRDTLRITGDTVLNGNTYFVVDGTSFGGGLTTQEFWRDSVDCIVNRNGHILFCYGRYDQNLQHDSLAGSWTADHVVSSQEVNESTPSGNYSCYVMTITYDRGFWGITYNTYSYARGVGRVKFREDFPAQPGGLEMKLMDHHVQ
jgi:hypothetical protein